MTLLHAKTLNFFSIMFTQVCLIFIDTYSVTNFIHFEANILFILGQSFHFTEGFSVSQLIAIKQSVKAISFQIKSLFSCRLCSIQVDKIETMIFHSFQKSCFELCFWLLQ